MERALKIIAGSLPLIFSFAFLVPVIVQGMAAIGIAPPFGLAPLTFALMVGGTWGFIASLTGRWI